MPLETRIVAFKVVAVTEALSWGALLAGMYLKHVVGSTDRGVELFGPVHGAAFLAYVALTLMLARALRWTPRVTLLGLVCSVPPFATLAFERWTSRTGRLDRPVAPRIREPVAR